MEIFSSLGQTFYGSQSFSKIKFIYDKTNEIDNEYPINLLC